ncbi:BLUF domain-containing protein [Crateriforma conspicua]|uniref:Blue light-and temperature-regulated antirepressor YcgF n=1 Tax=Crateriforma conspicua TaxID=2527996 RepID=A0A5C6FNF6_9PLAN|nr:BLUF domain-containing protein [Crateriforma conspicua]TWU62036.1 Blue light- and temperature-regulated antirepressor YcgF [Crateriforma conspicua]
MEMNHCDHQSEMMQLVYVSAATVAFSDEDLETLLAQSRRNNAGIDVSGVLLFHEGTFLQVLEGTPDAVDRLYQKIARDDRHDNVLLLSSRAITERNFGQWSMGFLSGLNTLEELPGFVDFFRGQRLTDLNGDSKRVSQILDGFRRGRWRRSLSGTDDRQPGPNRLATTT